ncbi:glycerate kinase, partial [Listeria monocytogenes]|uniref:glycerate kinase n=1 Tax=Listeria monocytogenes TaxID=1639 RepID=UPI002497453D
LFGVQKGATPAMIRILDESLTHYAEIIKRDLNQDLANYPGAGAAGGLGTGLLAFTNASIKKGIDIVTEYSGLKEQAQGADFVFTGEGGVDYQTK